MTIVEVYVYRLFYFSSRRSPEKVSAPLLNKSFGLTIAAGAGLLLTFD
jgi:hypothetical protein